MTQCSEPNCYEKVWGNKYCRIHNPNAKKTRTEKKQIVKQQKADIAQAAAEKNAAIQQARRNEKAQQAKNKEQQKQNLITKTAREWNTQIGTVVNKVKTLRASAANSSGINAGDNAGAETIPGGSKNPIVLTLPANSSGVTKAMIAGNLQFKLDNSFSTAFKYRVPHTGHADIFVHCS